MREFVLYFGAYKIGIVIFSLHFIYHAIEKDMACDNGFVVRQFYEIICLLNACAGNHKLADAQTV